MPPKKNTESGSMLQPHDKQIMAMHEEMVKGIHGTRLGSGQFFSDYPANAKRRFHLGDDDNRTD